MTSNGLKIAYVGISRTAGRSIGEFLSYNLERRIKVNNPAGMKEGSAEFYSRFNLFEGHFGYQTLPLPRCFKYVTVLREPISRIAETYGQFMGSIQQEIAIKMRAENWSFTDFITSDDLNAKHWVNNSTVYISGIKTTATEMDIGELLDTAIENLKYNFDFVGIYERFDDTIFAMKEKYNLKGDVPKIGKSVDQEKYELTGEEIAVAKKVLLPDLILYRVAEQLFDATYRQAKEGFCRSRIGMTNALA